MVYQSSQLDPLSVVITKTRLPFEKTSYYSEIMKKAKMKKKNTKNEEHVQKTIAEQDKTMQTKEEWGKTANMLFLK